jgi:acyl-CoA thioesterase FadM
MLTSCMEDDFVNLFLRFFIVYLTASSRPRLHALGESLLTFRVWFNDLDINAHMNNGRYLTLMDLGNLDIMLRTGLFKFLFKHKWRPIMASVIIRYKHALRPFQKYQLRTRLLCWDEKWFFAEQRFERDGEVVAISMAKGLFRGPAGNVSPTEVFKVLGCHVDSPPVPESVAIWQQSEALLLDKVQVGSRV